MENPTNIDISPKYKPMFDLLQAKERLEEGRFNHYYTKEYCEKLNNIDTVIMTGGRDSGKTFCISMFSPLAALDYNHRILFCRYTMKSAGDSIIAATENRMELLGIQDEFVTTAKDIEVKEGKGSIKFRGIKVGSSNQTGNLKSLEDLSMFIMDEAEEMPSYDDWNKIKKSIRAKDVQCLNVICMNPATFEHWVYEEFFLDNNVEPGFCGIKDNILYVHTSYLDMNEDWIAPHNLADYNRLRNAYKIYMMTPKEERSSLDAKIIKRYKEYKFVVLGGWKEKAEGVIYEDWSFGPFDESLPFVYGLDYGFFPDPLAMCKVAIDERHKIIYLQETIYDTKIVDIIKRFREEGIDKKALIVADVNESRTTAKIRKDGYNIVATAKGAGSIAQGIKNILEYTLIVCPKNGKNFKIELNNYIWNNKKASIPIDKFNHLMDSMRYGFRRLKFGDSGDTGRADYRR